MSAITTSDGRKLHGQAAASHLAAEERRQAAEERLEDYRAVGRAVALMATKMTGLPAPDALRVIAGRDDALRILRLLGRDGEASPIVAEWEHAERLRTDRSRRQASVTQQMFAADPTHDPRYTDALVAGASGRELDKILNTIRAERAEAAAEAARKRAAREAAEDERWAPPQHQRSLILSDWGTDDIRSA